MQSLLRESIFDSELYTASSEVVIIIDRRWKEIGSDERILLQKILAAIQLNINGVRIVQEHQLDRNLISKSQRLISFGWNPENKTLYEQQPFGDGQIVCSESLDLLIKNDDAKKRLWQGLKKLFAA